MVRHRRHDDALKTWLANCIDRHLSCSGGELGDGSQMAQSNAHKAKWPRLVETPSVGEWVTPE